MIRETHYATVECDTPGCTEFCEFKAPEGPLSALWLPERVQFLRGGGWRFRIERGGVITAAFCKAHSGERGIERLTDQPINRSTAKKGDAHGEGDGGAAAIPGGPGADSGLCLFEL
jgi:hypothetical protein